MEKKKSIGERIASCFTLIMLVCTFGYIAFRYLEYNSDSSDIIIADTPVNILDVRPTGELYVLTTEVEDYYIDVIEDATWDGKDYLKCVQILREQISWVIDLEKVEYDTIPGTDSVNITMPKPEFKLSPHGEWFYQQGPEKAKYNANGLKEIVSTKIKNEYYKKENEDAARQKAQEIIGSFVKQCKKEPIFK